MRKSLKELETSSGTLSAYGSGMATNKTILPHGYRVQVIRLDMWVEVEGGIFLTWHEAHMRAAQITEPKRIMRTVEVQPAGKLLKFPPLELEEVRDGEVA